MAPIRWNEIGAWRVDDEASEPENGGRSREQRRRTGGCRRNLQECCRMLNRGWRTLRRTGQIDAIGVLKMNYTTVQVRQRLVEQDEKLSR